MGCNCDCSDSCPEIVPVTINDNDYTIDGAGVDMEVTLDSPTQATVDIACDVAGYFDLKCWFVDTPTPTEDVSLNLPTSHPVGEFHIITAADGTATIVVVNTAALATWYLCISLGNGVEISDALTLGV